VNEDEDRRIGAAGAINIQLLDLGRSEAARCGAPMRARMASLLLARRFETRAMSGSYCTWS